MLCIRLLKAYTKAYFLMILFMDIDKTYFIMEIVIMVNFKKIKNRDFGIFT
jgi:hypothetical protein